MRGIEADIYPRQSQEAAPQQAGGAQEDDRESDLPDEESVARTAAPAAPLAATLYGVGRRNAGREQAGGQSGRQSGARADSRRHAERPTVHGDVSDRWELSRTERNEHRDPPRGERHPEHARAAREDEGFGQRLTHQASARRAERDPHGEVGPP